ncbi:MAG: hypothetical protein AB7V16_06990 [Vulcanibacillus sp.]
MTLKEKVNLAINPKFPYVVLDQKNDVEISIGLEDRVLYITFLGSTSKKDWIHNFMVWFSFMNKPYKNMKKTFFVHSGFLKIYKICRSTIHKWVIDKEKEYDSIIITGHSLGGAISTLCCEDVGFLNEEKIIDKPFEAIVTGCPRVFGFFNSKLIKTRCKNLTRVINKSDIVPSVPFAILGYKHIGEVYKIGKRFVNIFLPSCVYNHDTKPYLSLDSKFISNKNTNNLYEDVVNLYIKFYCLLFSLIITFIIRSIL